MFLNKIIYKSTRIFVRWRVKKKELRFPGIVGVNRNIKSPFKTDNKKALSLFRLYRVESNMRLSLYVIADDYKTICVHLSSNSFCIRSVFEKKTHNLFVSFTELLIGMF